MGFPSFYFIMAPGVWLILMALSFATLRLSSHGSEDGRSNSFAEAAAPDEQPDNPEKSKQHM